MGERYMVVAAKYPFKGYYEGNKNCRTLIGTMLAVIKFQIKGFDIIDINYRK